MTRNLQPLRDVRLHDSAEPRRGDRACSLEALRGVPEPAPAELDARPTPVSGGAIPFGSDTRVLSGMWISHAQGSAAMALALTPSGPSTVAANSPPAPRLVRVPRPRLRRPALTQAWLQVIGLCLDFLGFALIAFEWLLAQRAEAAQRLILEQQARAAEGRDHLARVAGDPGMQRHLEAVQRMAQRRTDLAVGATRESYARRRYGVIYAGMALVAAGFACQMLAAWPGCCRAIGILPAG